MTSKGNRSNISKHGRRAVCRVLGVSRNGYYSFQKRQAARPDDLLHRRMVEKVKENARTTDYTCGSRRMKKSLNAAGYPVNRHQVRKLMREADIYSGSSS